VLHRLFAWFRRVSGSCLRTFLQHPRQSLLIAGICALVLAVASPFLWASYHWFAGQADLGHYRNAEARRHLNACLKVWPWSRSVHAHLLAARAARRDGDFPKAFERLQEVQSTLGDHSSDTLLEWSLLHAAGGDLNKVERYLRESASVEDPETLPLILEALALGYMHLSRVAEAIQSVDQWLARDPENVEALFLRSSIYRQSGSWTEAAPDLRRVVELEPERPWARWWLAVALVSIGHYDEGVRHLEMLRQRTPKELDKMDVLVRLAICWQRMGRNREARELLDKVLAQRPDNGLALLTRGQIDQMNGQLPQAEKWLRHAAEVLPYDYKAHWALTECLRQQGKSEEAQTEEAYANRLKDRWERYSEITVHQLSQQPNNPALYCELGKLLLELGNPEGGKNWLYSALLLDPDYAPALNALADYYEKQGDSASAEDFRRQAQESTSQPAQAHNSKK
jgi:tetratricopeptide (TPR) repeat protein